MERPHKELDAVAKIWPTERDYRLELQSPEWGKDLPEGWHLIEEPARHFVREIPVHAGGRNLQEHLIPLPAAPIFAINRKAEYGMTLPERANLRTVRVLQRPGRERPIRRLFILHNGLNERDSLRFYYRFADRIIKAHDRPSEGAAACVIFPFPGHLTHFNFHGPFSETPLARYLSDAGELFRQFLRHMVEMRWFLSMALDSDAEPWMVGGRLLTQGSIARRIFEDSNRLYDASGTRLEHAREIRAEEHLNQPREDDKRDLNPGLRTKEGQIRDSRKILRSALGRDTKASAQVLRAHVVGYSLGGFLAQSVFFAWPQAISSCTTICSGGAIKALSPTAFAHPEEWQSVLHSLRPELNNSMLQGRLGDRDSERNLPVVSAAGLPLEDFGYFERIFDQVFLQEDRGSYKERLSEYGPRMLFVSGGDDPIVRPTNILDASPAEGITMLSVSRMSHFLDLDPDDKEKEQREFWLPEAGRLLTRAAIHSEVIHEREKQAALDWRRDVPEEHLHGGGAPSGLPKNLNNDDAFESALDWALEVAQDDEGWLFICRNTLPPAFIHSDYFDRWGMALHHHDVPVQKYAAGLRHRASALSEGKDRTTLVVPELLKHWFVDLSARFDPHSDAPSGRMTVASEREDIWIEFEDRWRACIRKFKAGRLEECHALENFEVDYLSDAIAGIQEVARRYIQITALPDVWIGIKSNEKISFVRDQDTRAINLGHFVNGVAGLLKEDDEQRARSVEGLIKGGHLRVINVSGAEFNPRYRGKLARSPRQVTDLLAWVAASLVCSRQISNEPTAS